jgi:hypothetical protein
VALVRRGSGALTALSIVALLALSGCGVAAFPCRASSSIVKIVPLVGHPVAAPLDACATAIDP